MIPEAPTLRRSRIAWPSSVPVPMRADDEPLVLPDTPVAARRTQIPLLASVVPVIGAVALWLVTGSIYALWFALLGPLIAVATLLDGHRAARRERRRAHREAADARERIADEVQRRHARERTRRWDEHPDVAALAVDDTRVWRSSSGADEIVVGRGSVRSALRISGGTGDAGADELKATAASLPDAPVTVPIDAGIAVCGPPVLAGAVLRALVVQACAARPPGALRLIGGITGEHLWSRAMPHRRVAGDVVLALVGAGESAPGVGAPVRRLEPGAVVPPECAVTLTVTGLGRARLDAPGVTADIMTESIGIEQAATITERLAARAEALYPTPAAAAPVRLASLLAEAQPGADGSLAAVIGMADGVPATIDLVGDGPHAVVAGVTGAGKSELLITWVTALCATHTTADVTFLLVDFKGGTAFDSLRALPHVTGVMTDLDGTGARRALESLRAEIRRREEALAAAGARDVRDPRVTLPRLVIVIDEFAALLADHPELQQVFTDVGARGRALGLHLVLGTQRVAGVVREALLANCPLRISLRVSDPADSRAVIGSDEAARLPGGAVSRGIALVRRSSDAVAHSMRVALTDVSDIAAAAERAAGAPAVWRPWLPDLPLRVEVRELVRDASVGDGTIILGLADDPARQRQQLAVLGASERGLAVVGMAGSGRTTALAAVAAQVPPARLRWIPDDAERAWDAIVRLDQSLAPGTVVIVDDLDALLARFGADHAHLAAEHLERIARLAGDAGIRMIVAVQRVSGSAARIADLLPRRAVLATPSRADHVAAGGDGSEWLAAAPPGRARLDGRAVQLAVGGPAPAIRLTAPAPLWRPVAGISGVVVRRGTARRLTEALGAYAASIVAVEDAIAHVESARAFDAPVVVVGDADAWQRGWRVLGAVRAEHDLIIDTACAGEYRLLTGERDPPPYCAPIAGRAWLLSAGEAPRRVQLPTDERLTAAEDPI